MKVSLHRMSMVWTVAAALVVGLAATSAKAAHETDLDDVVLGSQVGSSVTNDLYTVGIPGFSSSTDIGDLTSRVYENAGLFTYTYEVTPDVNFVSEFSTGFSPLGYTGTSGWDYFEAWSAGGVGDDTDFSVVVDDDGTIDWNVVPEPSFWGEGESITFFYQSTFGPGIEDVFNMTNHRSASGLGIVPVPEPASVSLLGVLGLAMLRRRRNARA